MTTAPPLTPGWWVALNVRRPIGGLACYVGQVQATTSRGVRITLVDWLTGAAGGYDVFVPWDNVDGALVATSDHDLEGFSDPAGRWQTRSSETSTEKETTA